MRRRSPRRCVGCSTTPARAPTWSGAAAPSRRATCTRWTAPSPSACWPPSRTRGPRSRSRGGETSCDNPEARHGSAGARPSGGGLGAISGPPGRMVNAFGAGGRSIGAGAPVFLIAEAGVNHNGDLGLAMKLVDVAAEAGADAVKFQTFRSAALVSRRAPKAAYQRATTGDRGGQAEMLARLELGEAQHAALMDHCARRGILFFSTPFDEASADLLERLGVPLLKVPSGEITNLPFLRHLAGKRRPLIVSTGMSTLEEVARAVTVIGAAGDPPLALLHCVSAYPAPAAETNLRAMDALRSFDHPVRLSDHTTGITVAVAAVARGAAIGD